MCPYTSEKIEFVFEEGNVVGIQRPEDDDVYWKIVDEEEFYSFYYDPDWVEEEEKEETIQYEDHSDLVVTPTYDVLEFYGIGDESDFKQITYVVTVDFETFDYYDFEGAYCVLRPKWEGAQIVSLLVDPSCQYY